jgi:hypothetical protein
MGKKHREKRQRYVELLRQKEKERDEYLEKRKRRRECPAAGGVQEHDTERDESQRKKRRIEQTDAAKEFLDGSSTEKNSDEVYTGPRRNTFAKVLRKY